MFKALVVEKDAADGIAAEIRELEEDHLPEGDVTVDVQYSTVNYKDGLVLHGLGNLVKTYPHVPGVDFAGIVRRSDHPDFQPGDPVVLTGWRVGEVHWGGYATCARVKGDWLVRLPGGLSPQRAMAVGTAGFTAMLAVMALEEQGLAERSGEVLVTGASGGVGSVATAILARLGYAVAAMTGRPENEAYLRGLGAGTIVDRAELAEPGRKPLEAERWAGCIDAVGGTVLARALAQLAYGGSVAAVGLAGGNKLETTVVPFLLRGVNLLGVDSVLCPQARRRAAWQRIARDLPVERLDAMTEHARLDEVPRLARDILQGRVRGRVVVDVNG